MRQAFAFTAAFHRASIAPKRLFDINAYAAIHFFAVFALAANNSTS
jgi:hypothetical protein